VTITRDRDAMRIAIFSEVYWPMVSGVSRSLQRLVEAMTSRGHECRVYAPSYPLPAGEADQPEVHRSPSQPLFLYRDVRWGFPRVEEIAGDLASFRPDVVHVATEFAMGVTGVRLARQFELPIIASAHTDHERYATRYRLDWALPAGWRYLRWFYGNASRVLCPSRVYESHLNRRGVAHTGIWSRGIDRERFSPVHRSAEWRRELGIEADAPVVLYVGRLAAEKNLDLLLEGWRHVVARRPDAALVLVGSGPLASSLDLESPAGVILTGTLEGAALSRAYASADLFAFPSTTETFGNVLLEAMASGLPSLAVRAGGVLDFAVHGHNAMLAEPDSATALAEGILSLLDDPALRNILSRGALQTAQERDWGSTFDALEAEYRRVVAPRVGLRAA
jgi:glycosyltransferase involved in cell wall biosynthesis